MAPERARFVRLLGGWAALTVVLAFGSCVRARIEALPGPSAEAARWAEAAIRASIDGAPIPNAPPSAESYRAGGPIVISLWLGGREVQRYRETAALAPAVRAAARAIAESRASRSFVASRADAILPRLTIPLGEGPLPLGPALLESLGVVPLLEGVEGRLAGRSAVLTPDDLVASGVHDRGATTPIPDLRVGTPIEELRERLGRELGASATEAARIELVRFRAAMIGGPSYPRHAAVTESALREAASDGARFLLRHQRRNGRYTYVYDATTGRERDEAYNLPRHSGTTYFLAQVDRLHGMPEARAGALRALAFLKRENLARCGGADVLCIRGYGDIADVGSAALTVIAATEILAVAHDPLALELTRGLSAFLRAQQRPDGELMHEYD
ncbi:MAG: hypothetical protein H5U40_01030, partial [Polyangiaceae bacterium]|nr:hypothetical protein [Polyangiaceae bacterium]